MDGSQVLRELEATDPDQIPQTNRSTTYQLVLRACVKAKEWEIALEVLDSIEASGHRTRVVVVGGVACCGKRR